MHCFCSRHSPFCIASRPHFSANKVVRGFPRISQKTSLSASSSSDLYLPKAREYESNQGHLTQNMKKKKIISCCNQLMFNKIILPHHVQIMCVRCISKTTLSFACLDQVSGPPVCNRLHSASPSLLHLSLSEVSFQL